MVRLDERNRAIYERRKAGATYPAIAREYGISPGRASEIVEREFRREMRSMQPAEVAALARRLIKQPGLPG
jgi:hypothetical protein